VTLEPNDNPFKPVVSANCELPILPRYALTLSDASAIKVMATRSFVCANLRTSTALALLAEAKNSDMSCDVVNLAI
jgi:hypothetical protein